eukprot:GILJ01023832.1.p1 GENE.GILJ01023832.1~~GILJ01023832.1.p1  ORF type:complete len:522 (-),score=69.36 GILJ01023832.1:65-1456(-)
MAGVCSDLDDVLEMDDIDPLPKDLCRWASDLASLIRREDFEFSDLEDEDVEMMDGKQICFDLDTAEPCAAVRPPVVTDWPMTDVKEEGKAEDTHDGYMPDMEEYSSTNVPLEPNAMTENCTAETKSTKNSKPKAVQKPDSSANEISHHSGHGKKIIDMFSPDPVVRSFVKPRAPVRMKKDPEQNLRPLQMLKKSSRTRLEDPKVYITIPEIPSENMFNVMFLRSDIADAALFRSALSGPQRDRLIELVPDLLIYNAENVSDDDLMNEDHTLDDPFELQCINEAVPMDTNCMEQEVPNPIVEPHSPAASAAHTMAAVSVPGKGQLSSRQKRHEAIRSLFILPGVLRQYTIAKLERFIVQKVNDSKQICLSSLKSKFAVDTSREAESSMRDVPHISVKRTFAALIFAAHHQNVETVKNGGGKLWDLRGNGEGSDVKVVVKEYMHDGQKSSKASAIKSVDRKRKQL